MPAQNGLENSSAAVPRGRGRSFAVSDKIRQRGPNSLMKTAQVKASLCNLSLVIPAPPLSEWHPESGCSFFRALYVNLALQMHEGIDNLLYRGGCRSNVSRGTILGFRGQQIRGCCSHESWQHRFSMNSRLKVSAGSRPASQHRCVSKRAPSIRIQPRTCQHCRERQQPMLTRAYRNEGSKTSMGERGSAAPLIACCILCNYDCRVTATSACHGLAASGVICDVGRA